MLRAEQPDNSRRTAAHLVALACPALIVQDESDPRLQQLALLHLTNGIIGPAA